LIEVDMIGRLAVNPGLSADNIMRWPGTAAMSTALIKTCLSANGPKGAILDDPFGRR
jgi:hypothetical protein